MTHRRASCRTLLDEGAQEACYVSLATAASPPHRKLSTDEDDYVQAFQQRAMRSARLGVETSHQDAVKLGCDKGQAGLRSGLSKCLLLHLQRPQRQAVLAEEARQRAAAVLDGKLGAVLLRTPSWCGSVDIPQRAWQMLHRQGMMQP